MKFLQELMGFSTNKSISVLFFFFFFDKNPKRNSCVFTSCYLIPCLIALLTKIDICNKDLDKRQPATKKTTNLVSTVIYATTGDGKIKQYKYEVY